MATCIKTTIYEPSATDWGKPIKICEFSINRRLKFVRVSIDGKLAAIFDNPYDAWDLVDDGPEFLRELKASNDYCFTHKKSGAVISNSLGPIRVE